MKRKMFDVISIILVILSIPMFLSSCKNSDVKNRNDTTHSFNATVIEMELAEKTYVMVEPSQDAAERKSCDRICFEASKLPDIGAKVGSIINVTYEGDMIDSSLYKEALIRGSSLKNSLPERCPVQINAIDWRIVDDTRNTQYTEQWLEKTDEKKYKNNNLFADIRITKIYSNCFFAQTVMPMPYKIKLNGTLPSKWCVGDQVICTYENTYYNTENNRVEADMLTIKESNWQPDPFMNYKPVSDLYPEEKPKVSGELKLNGKPTCTYKNVRKAHYFSRL